MPQSTYYRWRMEVFADETYGEEYGSVHIHHSRYIITKVLCVHRKLLAIKAIIVKLQFTYRSGTVLLYASA